MKQIEKLEVKELKRSSLVRPFIRFEFEKPSGRDVLRMDAVSKSFGKKKEIFKDLNLNINRGDKIAVTEPNGIGKSTLLKLMVGGNTRLDADTKKDVLSPDRVRFAGDTKRRSATSRKTITKRSATWRKASRRSSGSINSTRNFATQESIRGILGRLLFSGEAALKPLEALSGGEAARLLMAKLLLLKHNVLILDEPTNHLDIESIEGLIDGLQMFSGHAHLRQPRSPLRRLARESRFGLDPRRRRHRRRAQSLQNRGFRRNLRRISRARRAQQEIFVSHY